MKTNSDLTPIKVPGKRKREAAQDQLQKVHNKERQRSLPGRPPKRKPSPTSPTIPQTQKKCRPMKNIKPTSKMAALELLPAEILEIVLLFSLSFNLPHSSPVIAGKLSSHRTYIKTVKAVFHPTWDHDYKCIKDESLVSGRDPHFPSAVVPGDHILQSSLLRCHWASLQVLRDAEVEWLDEASKNVASYPIFSIDEDRFGKLRKWHLVIRDDLFDQDYQNFRASILNRYLPLSLKILNIAPEQALSYLTNGFLRIHPQTEVPDSVLRGPWTDETTRYLFWFFRAGANIRWADSTSGEVALHGLRQAIKVGNEYVICLFQHSAVAYGVSDEDVCWTIENAGGDFRKVLAYILDMYIRSKLKLDPEMSIPWTKTDLECIDEVETLRVEKRDIAGAKTVISSWMKTYKWPPINEGL